MFWGCLTDYRVEAAYRFRTFLPSFGCAVEVYSGVFVMSRNGLGAKTGLGE